MFRAVVKYLLNLIPLWIVSMLNKHWLGENSVIVSLSHHILILTNIIIVNFKLYHQISERVCVCVKEGNRWLFKRRHKVDEQTFSLIFFFSCSFGECLLIHSWHFLLPPFFPSSSILHFFLPKFHLIKDKHFQLNKKLLYFLFLSSVKPDIESEMSNEMDTKHDTAVWILYYTHFFCPFPCLRHHLDIFLPSLMK